MKQLKVLFVDDDINLGSFVSNILETDYNYRVHFQNTLIGINHIIQNLDPDIIILDVEVGTENGIEKAKDIVIKFPQIPIIFISPHTEENFITQGINIGADAYLPKPLSIPILISYIQRFASKKGQDQIIKISAYQLNLRTNELFYNSNLLKKLSPFEKRFWNYL